MADEREILAVFKADIEQYNAQLSAMRETNKATEKSTDNVTKSTDNFSKKTKSAANSIKTISNGLGGVTGLLALTGRLFGVNTDRLQELVFASQQFAQVGKKLIDTQKLAAAATKEGAAATGRMAAASAASIPIIGAVVLAIGAAAAIMIRYQDQLFGVSEATKEKMKADDGAIISDEKLRESYNQTLKVIKDLGIEYRLVTGQINEYQATIERLRVKNADEIEQIRDETKKKTEEITGFWAQVQLQVANAIGLGSLETQKLLSDVGKVIGDRNAIIDQKNKELTEAEKVELARRFAEIDKDTQKLLKANQDRLDKIKEQNKKAREEEEEARKKQHLENIRAIIAGNAELLKAEEKALEDKKKAAADEAEEIRRINQENDELTAADKKETEEKAKKKQEERDKQRIEDAKRVADAIFNAQQEAFDKRQELFDKEIDLQDKAIETQQRLAEQGLTNSLAFEERRAAELRRQQQIDTEKQKRVKLLETFLNSLAEFSKEDPKTALQKALLQVALAQAASAVFAEEGGIIGEIGERSNLSRRHKGGGDVLLHAQTGEGILSRKEMDNLGRRNFHLLKDAARFPIKDNVFAMPQIAIAGGVQVSNADVVKELKALQRVIKNKRENSYNLDEFGNYVKKQVENGVTTVTKGKLRKPRFK